MALSVHSGAMDFQVDKSYSGAREAQVRRRRGGTANCPSPQNDKLEKFPC